MDHPGNPLYEGTTTAARGIAESVAAIVMLAEYLRRSQELTKAAEAHRKLQDATREDLQRRRNEAGNERWRNRDASQWHLALDKAWMRTANLDEVVHVWAHTLPWLREDVRAQQAKRFAEQRLERMDPDLMKRYRHFQRKGLDPLNAMTKARRTKLRRTPNDGAAHTTAAPVLELGPVPDAWEAGPVIAGELPPVELLELEGPGPIPMGPTGWTDTDRVTSTARTVLDEVADLSDLDGESRARIVVYDHSVAATTQRPFNHSSAQAEHDDAERAAAEGLARSRTR